MSTLPVAPPTSCTGSTILLFMKQLFEMASMRRDGLILASDLREMGVDSHAVRRALGQGYLVRVRRGAYVFAAHWAGLRDDARYRQLVRATCKSSIEQPIVSHLSAAAMHRLPLIGRWPSRVHALAPGARGGSSSSGFITHRARVPSEFEMIDGVRVTPLARTLVNVAESCSFLVSVTMADEALRTRAGATSVATSMSGSLTRQDLVDELEQVDPRYGHRAARTAFEFSDGRSGSPGESLSRVRMFELGFEAPELQVAVTTRRGRYDIDFGWKGARKFGEFDGHVKYAAAEYLKGRKPEDVVWEEKRREDDVRQATGRSFVRWVWDEVLDARIFFHKLADAGVPRLDARRNIV